MPIQYCNQHARLFNEKKNTWSDFGREKMSRVKDVYDYIGSFEFKIVETRCDFCDESDRQRLQKQLEKLDPSQ
jgi:hypothetical protein